MHPRYSPKITYDIRVPSDILSSFVGGSGEAKGETENWECENMVIKN